jgi:hypothetical protein
MFELLIQYTENGMKYKKVFRKMKEKNWLFFKVEV